MLGIDIDIRPHNRAALEAHPLFHRMHLIEGSSVDEDVVAEVRRLSTAIDRTMVVLDSNHSHDHVLAELRAYAPMVTTDQYLVVADTVIEQPAIEDRIRPWGPGNSPATALASFMAESDGFAVDRELSAKLVVTSSPGGYLRRIR